MHVARRTITIYARPDEWGDVRDLPTESHGDGMWHLLSIVVCAVVGLLAIGFVGQIILATLSLLLGIVAIGYIGLLFYLWIRRSLRREDGKDRR